MNRCRLARLYSVDFQAVRQITRLFRLPSGRRYLFPLGSGSSSVKAKLPVGKNDGCYGYINVPW